VTTGATTPDHVVAASPRVRRLTRRDLPAIVALQRAVGIGLPDGFVRTKSEPELHGYLDGTSGIACGIDDDGTLAAMSLLRVPSTATPNPSGAPPFPRVPPADWGLHTCMLEAAVVLPAARGRGYQRAMLEARRAHGQAAGMKWICAGVQLRNLVSWSNLLGGGMAIVGMRHDLGAPLLALLGSLVGRDLDTDPGDCRAVALKDAEGHRAALDGGYIGVRLASFGSVIYQRRRGVRRQLAETNAIPTRGLAT
jgi:hypothetical protein